ncbi:BlaI/MecI/CopY family transcriptional regulator [Oleiagrimonas sp. C23AA]|nr:BlaI/MecI/CopY family transcriptional regulator [Oleiagrimonas sp. C23AA]
MVRPKSSEPTQGEREILEVLWSREEATAREVTDVLSESKAVAFTTVQTMLKILDDKGFVTHRSEGRAFVYRPLISRLQARNLALRKLIGEFFNGSPQALAQHLLQEHRLDLAELDELQEKVDAASARKPRQ